MLIEDNKTPTVSSNDSPAIPQPTAKEIVRNKELRSAKVNSEEWNTALNNLSKTKDSESVPESSLASNNAKKDDVKADVKSEETPSEEKVEKKPIRGIQKRIDELLKLATAEKTEKEQLRAELEALKKGTTSSNTPPDKVEAKVEPVNNGFSKPKPSYDDFNTPLEYQEALADWKIEKYDWDKKQEAVKQAAVQTVQEKLTKFIEKGAELEKEVGLEEGEFKILTETDVGIKTQEARELILDNEFGPRILYDITSDEEEGEKFKNMSGTQQLIYLGIKAGEMSAKTKSSSKAGTVVTKAKAPVKDLKGSPVRVTSMPDIKKDKAAWVAWRNEERKKLGKKI